MCRRSTHPHPRQAVIVAALALIGVTLAPLQAPLPMRGDFVETASVGIVARAASNSADEAAHTTRHAVLLARIAELEARLATGPGAATRLGTSATTIVSPSSQPSLLASVEPLLPPVASVAPSLPPTQLVRAMRLMPRANAASRVQAESAHAFAQALGWPFAIILSVGPSMTNAGRLCGETRDWETETVMGDLTR